MKFDAKTIGLLASLAVIAILCLRYCGGPDERYWVRRAAYDEAVKERDSKVESALAEVVRLDAAIASSQADKQAAVEGQTKLREENRRLRSNGAELAADNEALKTELQPVIDANPKIKALIEGYDLLLVNKDAQIFNLTESYVAAKNEAAANYKSFQEALAKSAIWERQYNDEHALRAQGDGLRLDLERKYGRSRAWAAVGKWGPPLSFCLGLILGGI